LQSEALIFLSPLSDESDDLVDDEDEPEMDLEIQMAYKEFISDGNKQPSNARQKD
jgi:hypothetical protein